MAEGPFGNACASRKPFAVLYRGRGAGKVHRKTGAESAACQTHRSSESAYSMSASRRTRFFLLLSLSAFFATATVIALTPTETVSPLRSNQISRISFSDSCIKKQWSKSPEDVTSLVFGAHGTEPCRAELFFQEPLKIKPGTTLSFNAQGSRPHQTLTLEARDRSEDMIRTAYSPDFIIEDEPKTLRWTLAAKKHAPIQRISSLVLMAQTPHAVFTMTMIEFVTPVLQPSVIAAPPAVSPVTLPVNPPTALPVTAPAVLTPRPQAPRLPIYPQIENRWADLQGLAIGLIVPLALVAFVGAFFRRLHVRQEASEFSPLYEINMRTWKSTKDAEGIPHLGGLRSLTTEDLREIKDSGFHSIWLMGLWEVGPRVRAMSKQYGEDFQGSPYAVYDYKVSQDLGTEQDLDAIIREAHRIGLKIVVDFVPNHMGIDSQWLNTHPEYFLHQLPAEKDLHLSDAELLQRYPSFFPYRTPAYPENGKRVPKTILVAYGRDPYFYPWIDTAQLDYARPELRSHLIEMISGLARRVDGIRCDMAMLVLREQVKLHRHPGMPREEFDRLMPKEFWQEVIQEVKRVNPHFVFVAETYWSMEGQLQHLGFDYTYNKPLYEAICGAMHSGHAEGLMNFLRVLGTEYLSRSLHFLENHDEERAMNALGEARQRPAAVLLSTLPGLALIHQGQMEGRRERLPVQRVVPLQEEESNEGLSAYYKHLIQTTSLPVFRKGRLHVLYSNNPAFIAYARGGSDQQSLIVINTSGHLQKGMVYITPGLRLESGISYWFYDLYYDLKSAAVRELSGVQPAYQYPAAQILKQGIYVELQPHDSHVFLIAPDRIRAHKKRAQNWLRTLNRSWDLPLPARRLFGPVLTRAVDQTFVSEPLDASREAN